MTSEELYNAIGEAAALLASQAHSYVDDTVLSSLDVDGSYLDEDEVLEMLSDCGLTDSRYVVLEATKLEKNSSLDDRWLSAKLQQTLVYMVTKRLCPLPVHCDITLELNRYEHEGEFLTTLFVEHPLRRILYSASGFGLINNPTKPEDVSEMAAALTDCWHTSEYMIGWEASKAEARRQAAEGRGIDGKDPP